MRGISWLAEEPVTFQEGPLLHEVGWLDGLLVHRSVSQFRVCSVDSLFPFQDAKIEIEAIAVVGEIVDSAS
jgi:hypothetical protein